MLFPEKGSKLANAGGSDGAGPDAGPPTASRQTGGITRNARKTSLVVRETDDGYEFVDGEFEDGYNPTDDVDVDASFPDWSEWGNPALQQEHLYEETSPFQKFGAGGTPLGQGAASAGPGYEYTQAFAALPPKFTSAAAAAHLPVEMQKQLGDVAAAIQAKERRLAELQGSQNVKH